jgi:hypothetical protein
MKYLCLIYGEERKIDALPRAEWEALLREVRAYKEALGKTGQLLACERLEPVDATTTIRFRDGKAAVTDGPFTETKEQVGGFLLVEARDLNEAIRIASQFPPARFGAVEVRPVWRADA